MIFFAWISNHTSSVDDDVLKIEAATIEDAKEYAHSYCQSRGGCGVRNVYTRSEFKKVEPGWHKLLWGTKAQNAKKADWAPKKKPKATKKRKPRATKKAAKKKATKKTAKKSKSRMPRVIWANAVNLGGVYSDRPIRMKKHVDEVTGDVTYWDKIGDFDVNKLGLDRKTWGLTTFASRDKEEVAAWTCGALTVCERMVDIFGKHAKPEGCSCQEQEE